MDVRPPKLLPPRLPAVPRPKSTLRGGLKALSSKAKGLVLGSAPLAALILPGELGAGMVKHRAGMIAATRGLGKVGSLKLHPRVVEALVGAGAGGLGGAAYYLGQKPEQRGGARGAAYDVLRGAGSGTALSLTAAALMAQYLRSARVGALRAAATSGKSMPQGFRDYVDASSLRSVKAEADAITKQFEQKWADRKKEGFKDVLDEWAFRAGHRGDLHRANSSLHRRALQERRDLMDLLAGNTHQLDERQLKEIRRRLDQAIKGYAKGHSGAFGKWQGDAPLVTSLHRLKKPKKRG